MFKCLNDIKGDIYDPVNIVSTLPPKGIYTLAFSLSQDVGTVTVDRGLDNVRHKLTFMVKTLFILGICYFDVIFFPWCIDFTFELHNSVLFQMYIS